MKSLFFGMLALVALASCSNDEKTAPESAPKSLRLSLNFDKLTRAVGDPQTAGKPTLSDVYVEFFAAIDGTGTAIKQEKLEGQNLTNLNAGTNAVVVTAPGNAKSIRLTANNGATTVISNSISAYQNKDVKTEIPYAGLGVIEEDQANAGQYKATINLDVAVGRIEISGEVSPVSANKSVEVVAVYANNYFTDKVTRSLFTLEGASGAVTNNPLAGMFDLAADNTTTWGDAFKANATKCVGYQLFAGSYGVTLQVKVTDTTVGPDAETKFIVVRSFSKADADKAEITELEAGKIYKLDIAAFNDMFTDTDEPTTDDPAGNKSVNVTVDVMQWTVQNVTPNL